MPGGDRTGPVARGPMTGRGAGFCTGYGVPGYANSGYGAGACWTGRGSGRRNRFFSTGVPGWRFFAGNAISREMPFSSQPVPPQDELDLLKEQAQFLENGLKELQARMEALASRNKTE